MNMAFHTPQISNTQACKGLMRLPIKTPGWPAIGQEGPIWPSLWFSAVDA
jgi:hypothetical protein